MSSMKESLEAGTGIMGEGGKEDKKLINQSHEEDST